MHSITMATDAGIVLFLSACIATAAAYPELACAGPYEVQTKCMSLCPKFCNITTLNYECNDRCEPGCDCEENYFRNSEGECVYFDQCNGPSAILECEESEVLVPCSKACPEKLCSYLNTFEYVCTSLREEKSEESDKKYKCPIAFDPNNVPSFLISSLDSTLISVNYPHPTKYKRPEALQFARIATYYAPALKKEEKDEEENDLVTED